MTPPATTANIEALAAEIADVVYLDIAKWHLYLNDAKLHIPLAEQLYPLLEADELEETKVQNILRSFQVTVGGGRQQIPLLDLIPSQCQSRLLEVLAEYQQNG
jgi:hypothetical protein